MRQLLALPLLIIAGVLVFGSLGAWFASGGGAALHWRAVLVVIVTAAAAVPIAALFRDRSSRTDPAIGNKAVTEVVPPAHNEELRREVSLAIEHIQSIRVLLEISNSYRQPIPRAVPANLELVQKSLDRVSLQLNQQTPAEISTAAGSHNAETARHCAIGQQHRFCDLVSDQ